MFQLGIRGVSSTAKSGFEDAKTMGSTVLSVRKAATLGWHSLWLLNDFLCDLTVCYGIAHRIHGAAICGNMDPINIHPMLAYIPYMDPMGRWLIYT